MDKLLLRQESCMLGDGIYWLKKCKTRDLFLVFQAELWYTQLIRTVSGAFSGLTKAVEYSSCTNRWQIHLLPMERDHWKRIKRLQACASMGVWCEGLGACHANPIPLSLSKTEKVTGKSASGEENEGALGSITRLTLWRVIHSDKSESQSCRAGEKDMLCEARSSRADVRAVQTRHTWWTHYSTGSAHHSLCVL